MRDRLVIVAAMAILAGASPWARADIQPVPSPSPAAGKHAGGAAKARRRVASSPSPATTTVAPDPSPSPASPPAGATPHVYTNSDLRPNEPPEEPKKDAKDAKKGDKKASPTPAPTATPDTLTPQLEAERLREQQRENEWRARAARTRAGVNTAHGDVTRLENEAGQLSNRIMMSTDTNEILRLRGELQQNAESLQAARERLAEAQKALDSLEDDARRAGVPPGWVREY